VRTTADIDLVEWELTIPFCEILGFYNGPTWEGIIRGRNNEWQNLLIENISEAAVANKDVGAWVRFPVSVGSVNRLGPPPPIYPKHR
jgi:hypothetical protein